MSSVIFYPFTLVEERNIFPTKVQINSLLLMSK